MKLKPIKIPKYDGNLNDRMHRSLNFSVGRNVYWEVYTTIHVGLDTALNFGVARRIGIGNQAQ